jgi:deoxyribodipyrimidine photo-lyase
MSSRSIHWFRRDLRLSDNPALAEATSAGEVIPLFIVDPRLWNGAGPVRQAYLAASLEALDASLGGALHIRWGDPLEVLRGLLSSSGASTVFAARDFSPYGSARDRRLEDAGIPLEFHGSPYAVAPGRVRKPDGTQYRVYTPFYKAWLVHGWRGPATMPANPVWALPKDEDRRFPEASLPTGLTLPEAGEAAALERWRKFAAGPVDEYDQTRNRADLDGTSGLSAALKWGEIHPRTLLARLSQQSGHEVFRKEIAWREFYADVLFHEPHTSNDYYRPEFAAMRFDPPGERFEAWCRGETGYPFVDAGMRQLLAEGWMHNRLRMVVASFLVKDLHIEWQHGARHFMRWLRDGDVASNAHGWQWTAGCGTDASPYYRVFNPVEQGKRFDPEGSYIRKYVPELRHLTDESIHEPWLILDGLSHGYVDRLVEHSVERHESLARLEEIKSKDS